MNTPVIAALTAFAGIALAASAPAQAAQVSVGYADLDLKSADGRATLEKRIQKAARAVCGMDDAPTTGSKMQSRSRLQCYDNATSEIGQSIARAVEKRENKG
jgi:UrcA family protein